METTTRTTRQDENGPVIKIEYTPINLEPPVVPFTTDNDDGRTIKLKTSLLSIMNKYQTHQTFKRVITNMYEIYNRKANMYLKEFELSTKELNKTVDVINKECGFMQFNFNKEYTCDKTAENNHNLSPAVKKQQRLGKLVEVVQNTRDNLKYLASNYKDILVDDGIASLSDSNALIIEKIRAQQLYALYYNRMVKSFKSITQYTNRLNIIQYVLDTLLGWYKDCFKIFKEYNNVVIMGAPGSGKTVIASVLAQLLSTLAIVVDVDYDGNEAVIKEHTASQFVGQYVGQTGPKTLGVLNDNIEKVLFIDEAYAMISGSGSGKQEGEGFGEEAVTEIVNFLSTNIGKIVVIVAGYEDEMQDFLVSNIGLQRRFPHSIILDKVDPYTAENILKTQLSSYSPRYVFDTTFSTVFQDLFTTSRALYDEYPSENRSKYSKYLAKTLFGNGIGSIVNFAAKVQKMIELSNQDEKNINECVIVWTVGLHVALNNVMKRDTEQNGKFDEIAQKQRWVETNTKQCGTYYDHIQISNASANVNNTNARISKSTVLNAINNSSKTRSKINSRLPSIAHCNQEGMQCLVADNLPLERKLVWDDLIGSTRTIKRVLLKTMDFSEFVITEVRMGKEKNKKIVIVNDQGKKETINSIGYRKTWRLHEDDFNSLMLNKVTNAGLTKANANTNATRSNANATRLNGNATRSNANVSNAKVKQNSITNSINGSSNALNGGRKSKRH